jgi:hypothetical protein
LIGIGAAVARGPHPHPRKKLIGRRPDRDRDQCVSCGHQAILYNSCRDRNCPKCQGKARAKWLAARSAELLPVPCLHPAARALCPHPPEQAGYSTICSSVPAPRPEVPADRHLMDGTLRLESGSSVSREGECGTEPMYGSIAYRGRVGIRSQSRNDGRNFTGRSMRSPGTARTARAQLILWG